MRRRCGDGGGDGGGDGNGTVTTAVRTAVVAAVTTRSCSDDGTASSPPLLSPQNESDKSTRSDRSLMRPSSLPSSYHRRRHRCCHHRCYRLFAVARAPTSMSTSVSHTSMSRLRWCAELLEIGVQTTSWPDTRVKSDPCGHTCLFCAVLVLSGGPNWSEA